jgi:diguanylate cyclase (GGDEF)-like protein
MLETLLKVAGQQAVTPTAAAPGSDQASPFVQNSVESLRVLRVHAAGGISFLENHKFYYSASITIAFAAILQLIFYLCNNVLLVDGVTVYWPVSAFVVAVLLKIRRQWWPWILLAFVVSDAFFEPGSASLKAVIVSGNFFEILILALFLPRFKSLDTWLQEPGIFRKFMVYGLVIAPMSCALPVCLFNHFALNQKFWEQSARWMLADGLGFVLGLPLFFAVYSRETYRLFHRTTIVQTIALLSLIGVASWIIFNRLSYPIAFPILPLLLLVAFRMGFSGSVIAVNLLALLASSATIHGKGPFQFGRYASEGYRMEALQLFLIFAIAMCMPVTIVLSERKRNTEELSRAFGRMELLATQDGLTGIHNRRRFDQAIQNEWRRAIRAGEPVGLLMIDIDSFKKFNDLYGHLAGDDCLRRVALAVHGVPLRTSDLAARFGGEEFIVLLPGCNDESCAQVAQLIKSAVAALNIEHHGGVLQRVTVSIGCGVAQPVLGSLPALVIGRADKALYWAKERGRNRIESWSLNVEKSTLPSLAI